MAETGSDIRMIHVPALVIERVCGAVGSRETDNSAAASPETIAATGFSVRRTVGEGEDLFSLSLLAARGVMDGVQPSEIGGVVVATFSGERRFPGLAPRLVSELGLAPHIPAMDLQLACAAYPYALYAASAIARDTARAVLVVDGDVQSRLVDGSDASTAPLFSDASTATLVRSCAPGEGGESAFGFFSRASDALSCGEAGPVKMDGFKVFSFVASDVTRFLRSFGDGFDAFVPHQANMYMVRQLAKSLGLGEKLVTCGAELANPGSCSVPLALARYAKEGRALLAAFGAGLSASAATVRLAPGAALGLV